MMLDEVMRQDAVHSAEAFCFRSGVSAWVRKNGLLAFKSIT